MEVGVRAETLHGVPPTLTLSAAASPPKPAPLMVSSVPPASEPSCGEIAVRRGACEWR
jgi:hypothetical protein